MANAIVRNREVPFKGEVIDWHVAVYESAKFQHLCCAAPVLLPESFAIFENGDPPTTFAWLVPVTKSEARRIRDGEDIDAALRQKLTDVLVYDQRGEPLL